MIPGQSSGGPRAGNQNQKVCLVHREEAVPVRGGGTVSEVGLRTGEEGAGLSGVVQRPPNLSAKGLPPRSAHPTQYTPWGLHHGLEMG